jgi:hypothetical protein
MAATSAVRKSLMPLKHERATNIGMCYWLFDEFMRFSRRFSYVDTKFYNDPLSRKFEWNLYCDVDSALDVTSVKFE